MKAARSTQHTAVALGLLAMVVVAGRIFVKSTRNNQRSRFLSSSRLALGLPERRSGPARGVSARRNAEREATRAEA